MLREHNVQLRHFSDDVIQSMATHSAEALEDLGASDAISGKVHASFKRFLADSFNYSPNAEGGYLRARKMTTEPR